MKGLNIKSLIIGAVILALGFGGGYYFSQNQIGQEELQGLSITSPDWDQLIDEIACDEVDRKCELIFDVDNRENLEADDMTVDQIIIWLREFGIEAERLRDGRLCLKNVSKDGLPPHIAKYGTAYDPSEVCDFEAVAGGTVVNADGEVFDGSAVSDGTARPNDSNALEVVPGTETTAGAASATCEECLDYYRTQAGKHPVKTPPPAGCDGL